MADQVRINGNTHSWSSVYFKVGGERFYGVKSINYGDSRSRTKAYGMGRHHAPRGRTAGKYEVDPVTVTVEKATADTLREKAAQIDGGASFGNASFQIVVQYIETGNTTITDTIEECAFTKNASKAEENPDPLVEDLEFDAMRIKWNGRTLYDTSEGNP